MGVTLIASLLSHREVLFESPLDWVSRLTFGMNPFPESLRIAELVKQRTAKDDRIAVIGSEPQIYFYSHRRSGTGFIYDYALKENHPLALQMEEQMKQEVERSEPKMLIYIFFRSQSMSVLPADERITDWFVNYVHRSYRKIAVFDITPGDTAGVSLERALQNKDPQAKQWISIYERRDSLSTELPQRRETIYSTSSEKD